jgi:prepilin-type N-terminal cleavage/methylation domain-containing protein
MKKYSFLAFTLVELIVVVTILAILSTIGFVSYSTYLTSVRDTNRISQLVSISDGLNLYSTKNTLPVPDNAISITSSGTLDSRVYYQGYV